MWSVGVYDLGLTDAQFWRLSLREFFYLMKRHNAEQERRDLRAALICSVIANVNRDPKKGKSYQPKDFMPKKRQQQTPEQMLQTVKALNRLYGGKGGD